MKIGIIGLGNIGRIHARNIQDGWVENSELVAVANRSIQSLEEFEKQGAKTKNGKDKSNS